MQTKCWTLIHGKARHILQPNVLDCCILIHLLSIHPLDVEIYSINWSRILARKSLQHFVRKCMYTATPLMVLNTLKHLSWIICWLEDNRMESINQSTEHNVMSHGEKSINSFNIFFISLPHNFKALCFNSSCFFEHRMAEIWYTLYPQNTSSRASNPMPPQPRPPLHLKICPSTTPRQRQHHHRRHGGPVCCQSLIWFYEDFRVLEIPCACGCPQPEPKIIKRPFATKLYRFLQHPALGPILGSRPWPCACCSWGGEAAAEQPTAAKQVLRPLAEVADE